jgi:two-component system sensor histidine kinase PhoQ
VSSLDKVYHDKHIRFDVSVAEQVQFAGDAGDLAELLGNLGDNACKWCRQRVSIKARNRTGQASGAQQLVLTVADDGNGIPAELRVGITERGSRADPGVPGHGVGLAIVRDIVVDVYAGQLEFAQAELGGAEARIII